MGNAANPWRTAECSESDVAQSTVARYMTRKQGPPSQGWKTFLRNHTAGIASIDAMWLVFLGLVAVGQARGAPASCCTNRGRRMSALASAGQGARAQDASTVFTIPPG